MTELSRAGALLAGAVAASVPAMALAQESRALSTTGDLWRVVLFTFAGLGGLLLVAAIGYLYRRERGLAWEFQKPDASPHDAHDEEHD
ncbi:MAG: hypothetical protein V3S31_05875 [Dehalococcoidia bacterium]